MLSKQSKVLVVGQGLAGTLISYLLKKAGWDVHVISSKEAPAASEVAAGMWNPVAFRRVIPTWNASQMVRALHQVYGDLQEELGSTFLYKRKIHRFFPNDDYRTTWNENTTKEELLPYIGASYPDKGEVVEGGYVDLSHMISAWRNQLLGNQQFDFGEMDQIQFMESKWLFHGQAFDHLVICTGLGMIKSLEEQDWLRKNKGELLLLNSGKVDKSTILNNGKWVLPLEEGGYKL
ncbi:MAG: FAD-dependent oxidoreductase, partial [Bacteroidota bacterium]